MAINNKYKKGYTLIEILVAVGIFFAIIAAPTSFLTGSFKGQQRALSSQALVNNISYTLEYMSRSIRMAKKDDIGEVDCLLEEENEKVNYEKTARGGLKFRNYKDECQEFFLEEGRLKEWKKVGGQEATENYLTSDDLKIEEFKIGSIDSWDQDDNEQPRVTLFLKVRGMHSADPQLQPVIEFQTTISQRNLDVQY